MKNKCFISALLLAVCASWPACNNDPCDSTECLNGGECDNGECDCPPGYSGIKCQDYDPCYNIVCLNGGICISRQCHCPPGYSGTSCENYDLCHNVVCYNGGNCVDGQCHCPPGYSGVNCQTHLPPVAMKITKVVVTSYPTIKQNGQGWDQPYPGTAGAEPDLFVRIKRNSSLLGNSNIVTNASYHGDINLSFANTLNFSPLSLRCDVALLDKDQFTFTELVGSYHFFPEDYADTSPTIISLYDSNTWHKVKMNVHVIWVY